MPAKPAAKPKPVELTPEAKEAKARRHDGKEFPRALTRTVKAKEEKIEERGERETLIVSDPVELAAALKEGWSDPTP